MSVVERRLRAGELDLRDPFDREAHALGRALTLGAWAWPRDDGARRALQALGCALPEGRAGDAIVLAVNPTYAGLYVASSPPRGGGSVPLAGRVDDVWRCAVAAAFAALPLLWRPLRGLPRHPPEVCHVGGLVIGPGGRPPDRLDGESAGLPFALLVTSRALDLPTRTNVAATAAITAGGRLEAVDGYEAKLAVLREWAPGVDTLIVAAEDKESVTALAGRLHPGLTIRGARTLAEALPFAFADGGDIDVVLANALLPVESTIDERGELVDGLFRLALMQHGIVPAWRPVAKAAGLALSRWQNELPADELHRLRVAAAIADRHAHGNTHPFPALSDGLLGELPLPTRLALVAHAVQACTDRGTPAVAEAERLIETHARVGLDATVDHLKLLGAHGRLQGVTGRAEEALATAQKAARGHFERFAYDQVSYPLSEWLRLAAALKQRASFDEAWALAERVDALAGHTPTGWDFLRLAHACGLARLEADEQATQSHADGASASTALAAIISAHGEGRFAGPAGPALRALHLLALSRGHESERSRLRAALGDTRSGLLADLDAAVAGVGGDLTEGMALAALQAKEPQTLHHLLGAPLPPDIARAAYVARYYPY